MFTVIVAEKEYLDSIQEYNLFLKPLMEKSNVSFCEWIPSEETPAGSVPMLEHTVKQRDKWRCIVIASNLDNSKKNPFDAVDYVPPVLKPASDEQFEPVMEDADDEDDDSFYGRQYEARTALYAEYLKSFRPARFAAYEEAASQPLTRLMTFLNEPPYEPDENEQIEGNPFFAEYMADTEKKKELRDGILQNRPLRVSYPAEIICIAPRVGEDVSYDIRTSWETPDESKYSRFYDRNLYFDKMRYLTFDMAEESHETYTLDYVRFLYTTLILANNDTPHSVLQPNRVYNLVCEEDDVALKHLFLRYDAKLSATKEMIVSKLDALVQASPETLSDYDVRTEFCTSVSVPVNLLDKFDTKEMFADKKKVGLSTDCPADEYNSWLSRYKASRRKLGDLLKLPRRALKKATDDFRRVNFIESNRIQFLNEFQLEDVEEFTAAEELNMVETKTEKIHDPEVYYARMTEPDRKIRDKIETRMTKKTTVLLAVVCVLSYLLGFIPFISKYTASPKPLIGTILMSGGFGFLLIAAFVTLFFLRHPLRKLLKKFNGTMRGIVSSITGSADEFGRYLSHACNVMRGYSVLNYREENEPDQTKEIRILKKHVVDIEAARETMYAVLAPIAEDIPNGEVPEAEPYDFDFTRQTDYVYRIPFSDGEKRRIDFLQMGNTIELPFAFIKGITAVREELYDNDR